MSPRAHTVFYVDYSQLRRRTMEKSLKLASRDVAFQFGDLRTAALRLQKDDPGLDALVVYAVGWRGQEEALSNLAKRAEERELRVIHVVGETTIIGLDLTQERCRDCISYRNALDLADKVKRLMDERD